MVLRIIISTDLGTIVTLTSKIPRDLNAKIPEFLNIAGRELARDAATLIGSNLGIPHEDVDDALIKRSATELDAEFEISSNQVRFPYVRWITQRDEKVCPICGPRDGEVYRESEIRYAFPAHPNCRCKLEKVSLGNELTSVASDLVNQALKSVSLQALELFSQKWTE